MIIKDPNHEDYEDTKDWMGIERMESFDRAAFDLEEIQAEISAFEISWQEFLDEDE